MIRYDMIRYREPLFKLCATLRPDYGQIRSAVIHTVIIGHAGCAQIELGHTEIVMDAIQVAYSVRNKKKKDDKQKGLWDRQSNIEIVLYRYIRS